MDISVSINGKTYKYKSIGGIHTWVDEDNVLIPVFIHKKLREEAIASGHNESIFLCGRTLIEDEEETKTTKQNSKGLKAKFNPFLM